MPILRVISEESMRVIKCSAVNTSDGESVLYDSRVLLVTSRYIYEEPVSKTP